MSKRELVQQHRAAILALAARHGATDVRLFGSVARGEDNETSDVDLLVRLEPSRSLLDQGALLMDLRDLLGCEVNLLTEHDAMRPGFRATIGRDLVAI